MNWITVIWSMVVSACLTLALIHFLIWFRHRSSWVNLAFSMAATSIAVLAIAEYMVMKAQTPAQFATIVRWGHVPVFTMLVSLVIFIAFYFGTARPWIGILACGIRFLSLVLNFTLPLNLSYSKITSVKQIVFFGDKISVAVGTPNLWTILSESGLVVFLVYLIDAAIRLWKQGDRRQRGRAVVVGASITFFIIVAAVHSALLHAHVIESPYFISIPFMAIIVAMHYELSHDIFRATQIASQLRKSEERMALAAEAANMGMWVWTVATDEIWMTEKGRSLFGIAPGFPLTNAAVQELVHPDDREARHVAMQQALATRGHYSLVYRVLRPDGTPRWINARGRCLEGSGVEPLQIFGISIDITAQKEAEAEAKQRREEVTHLSRVVTVGEMATSLAHELNQPLTGIVTNASAGRRFINKGSPDLQKIDGLLEAVVADGRRASDIIRGIRGMVRKNNETRVPVNMNELITDVLKFARFDTPRRHCNVEMDLHASLPPVPADPVQLQQVMLNLLMNAFDSMREVPAEHRRIIITTAFSNGSGIRVSVRDFGRGLPEKEPHRIFEQFYSTKPGGMGMGLAITHSIVTAHGGSIAGESAENGGACIYFTLPVKMEEMS